MRNTAAMVIVLSLLLTVPAFCQVQPGIVKSPVYTWKHNHTIVSTDIEKRYDLNGDGIIDPAEAKAELEERLFVVHAYGKAVVNTPLEAEYDTNKDGVLVASEVVALKQSLQ